MKKKVFFAVGLFTFLVVTAFMIFEHKTVCNEPESCGNLAHQQGETRNNGDDEFLLPASFRLN